MQGLGDSGASSSRNRPSIHIGRRIAPCGQPENGENIAGQPTSALVGRFCSSTAAAELGAQAEKAPRNPQQHYFVDHLGLVVVVYYRVLLGIRFVALAAMLSLCLVSLAVGWLSGGPDPRTRKAVALTTSFRNAGVGMVIAPGSFAGTPVLSAVLAYTLVSAVGTVSQHFGGETVPQ